MDSMELILGSQSPRRVEILRYFSIPFRQVPSNFDEESIPYEGDPVAYARRLSQEKAKVIQLQWPEAIILTADTVVSIDGQCLGKPGNQQEMMQMLTRLCGRWHSVITAVCVCTPKLTVCEHEETRVLCNQLTPEEIHRYLRVHHLEDKAGSYAIQKSGSIIVKKIDGCYYNVCGLPINAVRIALQQAGIDLWDYLQNF